jgi:hypothetical protein
MENNDNRNAVMKNNGQLDLDFSPPADDALPEFPHDEIPRSGF